MTYIVSQLLNKEETSKMEAIFKAMDLDGDGMLSMEEIQKGYDKHFGTPIDDDEIQRMFKEIDTDGNGSIDYSEFLMATMNESQLLSQEKLKAAFKMFDKDGSGSISKAEIKEALGGLEEKIVEGIINEVDENNDGEISFEEFEKMMNKMAG